MIYRDMDQAQLDANYNVEAAIGMTTVRNTVADWMERGADVVQRFEAQTNLRYGDGARNRIDFLPCGISGAPTLVYIHGGYWQSTNKELYTFVAAGPLARGINVALVEYTNAPAIRLDGIVAEVKRAVAWTVAHLGELDAAPDGVYLAGHSAGGHLTAMMSGENGVKGSIAISGLFDLEPLRLSYLNRAVRMDEAEAQRNSPLLHLPDAAPPFVVAIGANELTDMQRQSDAYYEAATRAGLPATLLSIPGRDHMSILEELASPSGQITAALENLIARRI